MSKQLAIKTYDISKPAEMVAMASTLKEYILKQGLFTEIQGKKYAHVDGWQFAGFLTGMLPRVKSVENLSTGTEKKWQATVEIYKGEQLVGVGIALCSSGEQKGGKAVRTDEYAILSMAQTRATGKAYRNLMGWVMKLAGYSSTPSEEMKGGTGEPQSPADEKKKEAVDSCDVCKKPLSMDKVKFSRRMTGRSLCKEHYKQVMDKKKK